MNCDLMTFISCMNRWNFFPQCIQFEFSFTAKLLRLTMTNNNSIHEWVIKLIYKELVDMSCAIGKYLFITNLFIFFYLFHSHWPLHSQLSRLNLTKQVITSMNYPTKLIILKFEIKIGLTLIILNFEYYNQLSQIHNCSDRWSTSPTKPAFTVSLIIIL